MELSEETMRHLRLMDEEDDENEHLSSSRNVISEDENEDANYVRLFINRRRNRNVSKVTNMPDNDEKPKEQVDEEDKKNDKDDSTTDDKESLSSSRNEISEDANDTANYLKVFLDRRRNRNATEATKMPDNDEIPKEKIDEKDEKPKEEVDEEDEKKYKDESTTDDNDDDNEQLYSPYTIVPEDEDDANDMYLSKIVIRNTNYLTLEGARKLCLPYGKVTGVNRPQLTPHITFVRFSDNEEAKFAVEGLNNMFGFDFRAEICNKRDDWDAKKIGVLPEIKMIPQYPCSFLPPISINYPSEDALITSHDYENPRLESVDPGKVFCLTDWIPFKRGGVIVDRRATTKLIERAKSQMKTVNESVKKRGVFVFRGMNNDAAYEFIYGLCTKCNKKAMHECTECLTYYCSVECQKLDWPEHKIICGKSTKHDTEQDVADVLKSAKLRSAPFPERNTSVIIVSAINPWTVFIRSLEDTANREYLRIINDCIKDGESADNLRLNPKIGDVVLAKLDDRGFHRALVLRNKGQDVNIVYIDIGYYAKVKLCDLRLFRNLDLKYQKLYIHRISLKEVDRNLEDYESAMDKLNRLIETVKFNLKYQAGDKEFTLVNLSSGENLSKILNSIMDIKAVLSDTREFIDYQTDVRREYLPCGKKLTILITDRTTFPIDGYVSCILYENLGYMKNLEEKIEKYAKLKEIDKFTTFFTPNPTISEFCLAKICNKWYRCVCLETYGDGEPTLLLVDYGTIWKVPFEQIRKIPKKLAKPVATTACLVHGFNDKKEKGFKMTTDFMDNHIPMNVPIEVTTLKEEVENRMETAIKINSFFDL